MKKFKFLLCALFAVLACATFTACGDDDDDEPGAGGLRPLTGTWIGMEYYSPTYSAERKYVFNADGTGYTCRTAEGARVDHFTDYMVSEGSLYIMWEDDDDFDEMGLIEINGDTFRIQFDDDDPWCVFTRQ